MKENFGQFIRNVRTQRSLTLTQLAASLGVDSGALSKIENGKKPLPRKALPLLATAFEMNFDNLKKEYDSEEIASFMYNHQCSDDVLTLAEEKVNYKRHTKTKQSSINFK